MKAFFNLFAEFYQGIQSKQNGKTDNGDIFARTTSNKKKIVKHYQGIKAELNWKPKFDKTDIIVGIKIEINVVKYCWWIDWGLNWNLKTV